MVAALLRRALLPSMVRHIVVREAGDLDGALSFAPVHVLVTLSALWRRS
jgi:hypothetical protein